jgi:hypothetical protein
MHTTNQRKSHLHSSTSALFMALLLAFILLFVLRTLLYAAPTAAEPSATAQTGSISGQVTASDGGALGPLRVQADRLSTSDPAVSTTLDATGHYTLAGLAPGTYSLLFNADKVSPYLWEYYNDAFQDFLAIPVTVTANATTSGIDAVLQRSSTIQGQVTSERTGGPLAGVFVEATRTGGDAFIYYQVSTNTNGTYTITDVRSGTYHVYFNTVDLDGYAPEYYQNKSLADDADPITVTVGDVVTGINAALAYIVNITGSVTTSDGTPLAGVSVTAYDAAGDRSSLDFTNQTGHYTLTSLLPGPYRLHFGGDSVRPEFYADRDRCGREKCECSIASTAAHRRAVGLGEYKTECAAGRICSALYPHI